MSMWLQKCYRKLQIMVVYRKYMDVRLEGGIIWKELMGEVSDVLIFFIFKKRRHFC